MATVDKRYLDLDGLKAYNNKVKELIDKKVDKPAGSGTLNTQLNLYKIATNPDGLVTETAKVTLGEGTLTLQVNDKTVGTFNANAQNNSTINIKLNDLGLSSAMRFVGSSTTDPTGSSGATIEGYQTFQAGDVCLYKGTSKEYVYSGTAWLELGDEGSRAWKTIEITGADGLTGGGSLEANRTIQHAIPSGATPTSTGVYAIGTDKFGHVTSTKPFTTRASNAGNHTHTVTGSVTVPTVSATSNKKLSVSVTKDNFLTSVTPTNAKLVTTSIKPAVAVSEANRPTKTVYSDVTASKATAGTTITYGTANRAAEETIVGNANIATTPTTVGNADLGTVGKVNVTALNPENESETKNVYDVYYNSGAECLEFTAVILKTDEIKQAKASKTTIYGAEVSTKTIYGAVDSDKKFTSYTFTDVTASNITENTAVDVATAGADTTVATGRLAASANGDELITGISTTTAKAVTAASIDDTQATGVAFVSGITIGSTSASITNGSALEAGQHTHTITHEVPASSESNS